MKQQRIKGSETQMRLIELLILRLLFVQGGGEGEAST